MNPKDEGKQREWVAYCILHFAGDSEASRKQGTDKFRLEIGDLVIDGDGDVFLANVAFKRGDPIDHEFAGFRARREAGSNELRLIDPLGYETRFKFKGFAFCGIVWTSRWFRLLPRGGPVIHELES